MHKSHHAFCGQLGTCEFVPRWQCRATQDAYASSLSFYGLDLLRCDLSQKGDMPVHAVCSAGGRPDLQFERRAPPTCMELAKGAAQSEGASHCMTLAHSSEAIKRACVGISP